MQCSVLGPVSAFHDDDGDVFLQLACLGAIPHEKDALRLPHVLLTAVLPTTNHIPTRGVQLVAIPEVTLTPRYHAKAVISIQVLSPGFPILRVWTNV